MSRRMEMVSHQFSIWLYRDNGVDVGIAGVCQYILSDSAVTCKPVWLIVKYYTHLLWTFVGNTGTRYLSQDTQCYRGRPRVNSTSWTPPLNLKSNGHQFRDISKIIYIIDSIKKERKKLGIWKWEKGAEVMIGIESRFWLRENY